MTWLTYLGYLLSRGDRSTRECGPTFNHCEGDDDDPFAALAFEFQPLTANLGHQLTTLAPGLVFQRTSMHLLDVSQHGSRGRMAIRYESRSRGPAVGEEVA